jgi:uncharacterized membrane protein
MAGPPRQTKRPVSPLAGTYGHPFHPILVTVPIGAWVTSLVFDVASHLVHDPGFLFQGSVWLIAVGVAGAVLAATAGFLDLFAIPVGTPAFRTALWHMSLNLGVTAAYAAGFAWRLGGYDRPGPAGVAQIALSVAGLGGLAAAGYLGGKLAYRYGVRVADETTQAEGYVRRDEPGAPNRISSEG